MLTRDIHRLAVAFRAAIEIADKRALGTPFDHFPAGCCGQVAPLLGTFLMERGAGSFLYMLGHRPHEDGISGSRSHSWLQRDRLVVDLTADQFSEVREPVIVTRNSAWHRTWTATAQHRADFQIYDPHTVAVSRAQYALLTSIVDGHKPGT